jgi:subtilisin family serine protease
VPLICEANTLFFSNATPDDPRLGELYGLSKMQAPLAWNRSTGSAAVKVAVIDTGIDYLHPDLAPNIAINESEVPENGLDDDGNGYIDDYYGYNFAYGNGDPYDDDGHGTHCAGTIGARGDDSYGIVGVNWVVGLLPVKALDSSGSGYLSDIAEAIHYAIERDAAVISMSLGGSSDSQLLEDAIAAAKAKNIVVVAAAGNESSNNDLVPSFPANSRHSNVISVAATDSADLLAGFSNYGASTVDVAAPGVGILSTVPAGYSSYSGTSMATPHVAGLAALVRATNPALNYAEIKTIILNSVDKKAWLRTKTVSGGRINANAALAMAAGEVPIPAVTPNPSNPGEQQGNYSLTLNVKKRPQFALVSGAIKDSSDAAVSDEFIALVCNGQTRATTTSSYLGRYTFKVAKPKRRSTKPTSCYARNIDGKRSRSRRVW